MFVTLKKISLYLNRCSSLILELQDSKVSLGFFFPNNHIRVEDFIDMFCFVEQLIIFSIVSSDEHIWS
jgi:hypothetical protein